MLEVRLPYTFNKNNMYIFIKSVINKEMKPISNNIDFDFSNLRFIEPSGVTILSNVIEWLKQRQVSVTFSYPDDTDTVPTEGIKYLDDSMFFKHYLKETLTKNAFVRSTTLPLEFIAYSQSYGWKENKFIPWLSSQLCVSNHSLANIDSGFGEIFNNIRDHAEENTGCIYAQHYPRKNQIKISISDFGVGIPRTMRRIDNRYTDAEALEKAIEEGVSSRSTPRNRGAGLRTLVYNVVKNHGGSVQIRSYSGILNVKRNKNGEIETQCTEVNEKYPGTFFEITLNTTEFFELPKEEEFEWNW